MTNIVNRVRYALTHLPKASPDLAAYLEEQGITGRQYVPTACPLTRWLRQKFPGYSFWVTLYYVEITTPARSAVLGRIPNYRSGFADAFDHGVYPNLIEKEGDA